VLPLTWCEDTFDARRGQRWHWKQWAAPRPLFVPAQRLNGDPSRVPVVVVEGEKKAEAGHRLLGDEFDFVTWPGGAKAWGLARWSWLMGRTVYLWPDADAQRTALTREEREAGVSPSSKPVKPLHKQAGYQAMVGIGQVLLAEHGCTVFMLQMDPPGTKPDGWDLADAIEVDGWDAARVRDHIRASHVFVAPDDAVRAAAGGISTPSKASAMGQEGAAAGAAADDDLSWAWTRFLLRAAKTDAVLAIRENIVTALDGRPDKGVPGIEVCHGLIAFNEFSNNVTKRRPAPWGSPEGDWLESDELMMGDWLVREHHMPSMARQLLAEAVLIVAKRNSFHPLRERFEALRGKWDNQPRLDTWLRQVCLVEDEWDDRDPLQQYLTLAGRWFVMAMVARVMTIKRDGARVICGPGTKFDYMLILEGPQGWGKSTLARELGGEYFADTGLTIGDKDSLMNIQGVLVYEWGELENLTKQEVGKVKLFVSSPEDRFRATFDKRPAKYPRQVVFIGTTNEAHYLTDTTGNRRFWPVRLTRPTDLAYMRQNMEQMLAEAVHRVDAGERFYPTRAEQVQLFDPQQSERTVESSLESAIRALLYDEKQTVPLMKRNYAYVDEVDMRDLLDRVGYTIDKQTDAVVKKAGALMHMLGWTVRRLSGPGRPRVYVRPNPAPGAAGPSGSHESTPQTTPVAGDPATKEPTDDDPPF
jgi:putative DNA primase/helicase